MSIKDEKAVVPEDLEAPPALFVHAVNVYNEMLRTAEPQEDSSVIWEGKLTSFLDEFAGVSPSQYSRVVGLLVDMGCVARLRKGTGVVDARWAMISPPKFENYKYVRERQGYRREKRVDPTTARINELRREVAVLNERINSFAMRLELPESGDDWAGYFARVDAEIDNDDEGDEEESDG